MFYETARNDHGLPHDPFKSCVVPRLIGWITTIDAAGGLNLAPFSYFNACGDHPPQVMYAPSGPHAAEGGAKDTVDMARDDGYQAVCPHHLARLDDDLHRHARALRSALAGEDALLVVAQVHGRRAMASSASTIALAMPGSSVMCPPCSTILSFARGHACFRRHASRTGVHMS